MINQHEPPFPSLLTAIPFRGTRDEAVNAYHPEIDLADPETSPIHSVLDAPSQLWVAMLFGEHDADLLIEFTDAVRSDPNLREEARFLAGQVNTLVKACITDFVTYEQRKAEDLPASTPIAS